MTSVSSHSARHLRGIHTMLVGLFAGLAGGIAEIAWVVLYAGDGGAVVARGVTQSVFPGLAATSLSVSLGIAIHMALAVVLGLAIALLVRAAAPQSWGAARRVLAVVASLAVVWAVNFGVVLPLVNPDFVGLLPLGVSLASKLLFGVAAALVIEGAHRAERIA